MADNSANKPVCLSQFVFYPQQDPDDCGVSVLRMVAKYHGLSVSGDKVREVSDVPYGELSLLALSKAAKELGLNTLSLRLHAEELDQLSQWPAIAHTQGQHYVLIEKLSKKWVHLADPAYGRYLLTRSEFLERWAEQGRGVLLILEPGPQFRPASNGQEEADRPAIPLPVIGIGTIGMLLLESLLLLVLFQLLRTLLHVHDLPPRSYLVVGGFCLVVTVACALLRSIWKSRIQNQLHAWMNQLDQQVTANLNTMPESEWDGDGEALWIARAESKRLIFTKAHAYLQGIRAIVLVGMLGLYLGWLYIPAGILYALGILLYFLINYSRRKRMEGLHILSFERRISALTHSWYHEAGAEWHLKADMTHMDHPTDMLGPERPPSWFWLVPVGWILALVFVILATSHAQIWTDVIALSGIVGFYSAFQAYAGYQSRTIRYMLLPGYEGLVSTPSRQAHGELGEVVLVRQEENRGKQIVLHLPSRSSILIFGDDQPARSVLINQIAGNMSGEDRQLATSEGPFSKAQLCEWRQKRMFIRHASVLPVVAVGELITGRAEYDPEDPELISVLEESLLAEKMKNWPSGLATILAFESVQSQTVTHQVLIARALYQRPEWVILDEVFRHLDSFQEQVILENLVQARQGLNTVIVSRRMEMAGQVDWIIHSRDGQILEEGTFVQLMEYEGYLYSLITS